MLKFHKFTEESTQSIEHQHVPQIILLIFLSLAAPNIVAGDSWSIASLTCLALNSTVASCCPEGAFPKDGVCTILSCLDGLSIREGCSCYDIEKACELLVGYATDIAGAATDIADATAEDIIDMCDMVSECCTEDGTTATNLVWGSCMEEAVDEAAEAANFTVPNIVELLLGSIPVLLDLIPTGSTVAPPTKTPTETTAVAAITPSPTPVPAIDITVVTTTTTTSTLGSGNDDDNPCIICRDGTDVGDFTPYADDGDLRSCANLIDEAKLYEIGSDYCGWLELTEKDCCFTPPENPCIICQNGATAGDDYVPEYTENSVIRATCKDLIEGAKQFESESDACGLYDIDVAYCCPFEGDNTEGDNTCCHW